jgi:hypothetical protein
MEREPYTAIPGFETVYLEDSYVLAICLGTDYVEIKLDLVLTPAHPVYVAPGADQQHCMRRARLRSRIPQRSNSPGPVARWR